MATDRSSEALKWTRSQIRRIAPFAWLFSILFGLLALFFSGLERLCVELSAHAGKAGSGAYVKDRNDESLVSFAKFIRESAPFASMASILFAIFAIFFQALQTAATQIESRSKLVKSEEDSDSPPQTQEQAA